MGRAFILVTALVAWIASSAPAAVIVDAPFTDITQIRSASTNPYYDFGAGATADLAALNLTWGAGAGGTLYGIGFHDIHMDVPADRVGSSVAVANGAPGVTMDYEFLATGDPTPRNLTSTVLSPGSGSDWQTAMNVTVNNHYINDDTNTSGHRPNIVTFHGLVPNTPVYVQMIGGQHGWGGDVNIFVNGDGTTEGSGTRITANTTDWASNKTNHTAGLLGFTATTKTNGDLTLEMQATNTGTLPFAGLAALTVQGTSQFVPGALLDAPFTTTDQIVTTQIANYGTVAAAINFYNNSAHNDGGPLGSTTILGTRFDDVLVGGGDRAGPPVATNYTNQPLTANLPGVTLTTKFATYYDRDQNVTLGGTDAAAAQKMLGDLLVVGALDPTTTDVLTLSGLSPNAGVFVQLFGGDENWVADLDVYVNGAATPVGRWTTIADANTTTASTFAFVANTDAAGDLSLRFDGVQVQPTGSQFAGISGLIVYQTPEPSSLAMLLGLGIAGLIGYRWRRRPR